MEEDRFVLKYSCGLKQLIMDMWKLVQRETCGTDTLTLIRDLIFHNATGFMRSSLTCIDISLLNYYNIYNKNNKLSIEFESNGGRSIIFYAIRLLSIRSCFMLYHVI